MPNETMIKLGELSKRSPQTVEKTYNDLMTQMKKSGIGNNEYKRYRTEADKTPPNTNNVSKLYGEFMKVFNQELKKKLGINQDVQTEAVIDEESAGAITTASVGSPTMADGKAAPYGNSSIYAPKIGGGMQKRSKPDLITFGKKKKVQKESEEYLDIYFKDLI